jgi:hypothetical protein
MFKRHTLSTELDSLSSQKSLIRKPRNLELLLHIFKHEGACVSELVRAGFSSPQIYIMLGALTQHGLIRTEPSEVKTAHGLRYRKTFYPTENGKLAAKHLLEIEKLTLKRFNGREEGLV